MLSGRQTAELSYLHLVMIHQIRLDLTIEEIQFVRACMFALPICSCDTMYGNVRNVINDGKETAKNNKIKTIGDTRI